MAETEKGTAGIPRRVGIAAASAVKAVMQQQGISGPKELLVGLARPNQTGSDAARWAVFNWAAKLRWCSSFQW